MSPVLRRALDRKHQDSIVHLNPQRLSVRPQRHLDQPMEPMPAYFCSTFQSDQPVVLKRQCHRILAMSRNLLDVKKSPRHRGLSEMVDWPQIPARRVGDAIEKPTEHLLHQRPVALSRRPHPVKAKRRPGRQRDFRDRAFRDPMHAPQQQSGLTGHDAAAHRGHVAGVRARAG